IISLHGDIRRSFDCDQESCTLAKNIQAKADRDSIRLTATALQDEGEVPAKKAAKAGISADQDVKKITLKPSDPAKTTLIGTGLDDILESALITFLQANQDIFACKPSRYAWGSMGGDR